MILILLLFLSLIPLAVVRKWTKSVAINRMKLNQETDLAGKAWRLVGRMAWRLALVLLTLPIIALSSERAETVGAATAISIILFLPILLQAMLVSSSLVGQRREEIERQSKSVTQTGTRATETAASGLTAMPANSPRPYRFTEASPEQSFNSATAISRFRALLRRHPLPWAISFAAALAAIILTCTLFIVLARDKKGSASLPAGSAPSAIGAARNKANSELTGLVRKVSPAVAFLEVRDAKDQLIGAGTGFWVSKDGKLVTNLHVLQKGASVYVNSSGALIRDATFDMPGAIDFGWPAKGVLGYDTNWDLAVVQFDVSPNNVLELGEANGVEIGERILVIGNPQGLEGTVSEGIVSAKREAGGTAPILQITAPISPGSSGSPVFNASGKVVGVASAYVKLNGSQGLNFAVPAEAVSALLSKCAHATPKSLAAIATAESSTPHAVQPPERIIPPQTTANPVEELPKDQTGIGSGFTARPEDIRRAKEIAKVETDLFNWLQIQRLKPAIIAQIKKDNVTRWPRWAEILQALTGAKEKEELKRLLNARFNLSTSREQDLAISGLSTTMLALLPTSPVREPAKVQPIYDSIAKDFAKASGDTLRIEAIADPLQRQFETAKAFPEAPLNWITLADMLLERRRIKEARQYYEKAISVGPGVPAAWLGAAKTAEALKDAKRAGECRARYKELVRR